jgi:hypothetical protein
MRKFFPLITIILLAGTSAIAQVHMTYLWHMQQPNYWPERSAQNPNRIQSVKESNDLKFNGGNNYPNSSQAHPLNDLQQIFSKQDRVAVYQYRAKDAVASLFNHPEGGAQVNYSGCLMDNIESLANANQWGYSSNWNSHNTTARSWTTSGGNPRMDLTGFTYHHALSPLISDQVLSMQIRAHKHRYGQVFGSSPNYSKGFWPAECSFSERIIKVLVQEGFEWTIVANSHLARTLNDYPINYGTSGCNISPPNKADKVTTNGNNWWSGQIDGRGGTFAAPYCYQAHKAKYVDPNTGLEYKIDVVPMADLLSYQNGFSLMGTGDIDNNIAPYDDPNHPSMVLFAHDGDNAWGGGFDYYNNSVPGLANAASSQGYVPTTIQQFLDDHPVPANDVVKVEDGSWVNAANDWGHPQFINWLWPLYNSTTYRFDPNGWTEDARNWAVLVANENHVQMAEDLSPGTLDIADVVAPNSNSTLAEKAWHFLLPAYTSGYMYYGASLDMEVKQTLACNNASEYADSVISQNPNVDPTAPSVFIPQRFPYNPGGTGFGPIYGYQQVQNSSDFHVWTFAYDVEGIQSAVLKYRVDNDGDNPLSSNQNETYAGGNEVGAWQSISMSMRVFPKTNVTNNPEIDFFILPDYIANLYYAEITGLSDTLVDYYAEVTDVNGNVTKTPIQHVYVGGINSGVGGGGNGHGNANLTWTPQQPNVNDTITITLSNQTQGGRLHWGVNENGNRWSNPIPGYRPSGSFLFNGSGPAVQTPFNGPANGTMTLKLGPFNDSSQDITEVNFVINYNDGSWDNNSGQDYHITIDQSCTVTDSMAVTACNSYLWQAANAFLDSSGIYSTQLVSGNGCDSILVLDLTINESSNVTLDTVTSCSSYLWPVDSQIYSQTGWMTVTAQNQLGCDSVISQYLSVTSGSSIDSVKAINHNQGVYKAFFTPRPSSGTYRLEWKTTSEATWRSKGIIAPHQGSQRFNITPWFNSVLQIRIIEEVNGNWIEECDYSMSVPCKDMIIQTAEVKAPVCEGDSALVRVGYAGGMGAKSIQWSNGATTKFTYAQQGERLYATVSDIAGCSLTDSITGTSLSTAASPSNTTTTRSGALVTVSWTPPVLEAGQSLIGYRVNYRIRNTISWTTTPLSTDTFRIVDMTNEPSGNYHFAAISRYNDNGTPTTSNRSCFALRGWPGISSKDENSSVISGLEGEMNIYPNPTNDLLFVQAPAGSQVTLTDLQGKILETLEVVDAELSFNMSSLAGGVYLIKVTSESDTFTEQVIKK